MSGTSWHALTLTLPEGLCDPLSGLLIDLGATGTWLDGDQLHGYFPLEVRPDEVAHAVAAWHGQLIACGVAAGPIECAWDTEAEGDWITAWQSHFHPTPVGRMLMVLPEWCPDRDAEGRIPIRIRPGRGFGTGGHDTTATCMERIEVFCNGRSGLENISVLDVGTGSGILAVAAKKLGCGRVTAFDNDPDAVANARDNMDLNGISDIPLFTGTTDAVRGQFDLVAANLLAHVIVEIMGELRRLLAPGGTLLLSGILNEQGDQIDTALAAHGLRAEQYVSRGMWLTIEAGAGATPRQP